MNLKAIFLAVIFLSAGASADYGLPNNTGTKLMVQDSRDGGIKVLLAHIHKHAQGQDLVLKLELYGLGYDKEIWVQDLVRNVTQAAPFVSGDLEVRTGGTSALWLGNPAPGVEHLLLKVSNVFVVSQDDQRIEPHGFTIYIKSRGQQFENRDIRVYR
jgi:hypothetical protein